MLKLRLIFYYTTAGIALGFLFCMLMFFNVALGNDGRTRISYVYFYRLWTNGRYC